MELRLGKKAARPAAIKFKLANYIDKSLLPRPPKLFGRGTQLIGDRNWDMLGNDKAGCCVWSGAAHEHMLWNMEAGKRVAFSEANVLADYTTVTGYNPSDPSTDNGTDMKEAASYRRKVGVSDVNGERHKIEAYLSIKAGDEYEHALAAWLFGAVGIGIVFPNSAWDQFKRGVAWTPVRGSHSDGGHYVSLIGKRRARAFECVTWGRSQLLTEAFFKEYNDESVAYVSHERLIDGKSLDGFDANQLLADLSKLTPA